MIVVENGDRGALDDMIALVGRSFPQRYGEAWNPRQMESMIALPNIAIYLARKTNALAGFAITRTVCDQCELLLIAVDPPHRREGIGARLIDRIIADARGAGISKLFLEMRDGNFAGQLYERFGFERVGRRANYYNGAGGVRYDALTYAVAL